MADQIVASFCGPAVEEVGRSTVATIKRQFNYLCCFTSNIQSLKDEARNLETARVGLQMQVDTAERNAEVIVPGVKDWLTEAEKQIDITEIEDEMPKVQRACLNMKSRYSLSRKAEKATEAMKELRERCNFNHISEPAPPAAMVPTPIGTTIEFQSRKQIEEDIMEALRGKKVNSLGICGMGGVGKTTMAKRIMNRVREETLFEEVLMVVVSQPVNMTKIQRDIAESLGLKLEEESLSARANKLRIRLMDAKGKLIILDDVWEKLNLEDLVLPCETGVTRCVVLLTSRDKDVLNRMCDGNVCVMKILSETEAWDLFREKAGKCVDDSNLRSIAEEVAKECNGLPVALVTLGSALKDEKSIFRWNAARRQLKQSYPAYMPGFIKEVYKPLKLSYEFLETLHAKSLFLLCRLFPEDYDINLDELTLYCMGSRIFERDINLEQARDRVFDIVWMLKSRFLLLDGKNERHVKMHDVVCDVANFIALEQGLVDKQGHSNRYCKWISVFMENKTELQSHCLLTMGELSINFEEMKELNVLSMYFLSLESLPLTTQLLKNLRTLRLEYCTLEKLSVLVELSNLEILCCRGCWRIEELPVEIGRLNRLKLLEFIDCPSLKIIARGVISNLCELNELNLLGSFTSWEFRGEREGEEKRNASLDELEVLSNLTCLKIEINDCTAAAQEIHLSSSIMKYLIRIRQDNLVRYDITKHEKAMILDLRRGINLGSWVGKFVSSADELYLTGDGLNNFDFSQAQNTKDLKLDYCSTIKHLWKRPNQNVPLGNLREISIQECANLQNLFPLTMASSGLLQLEQLKVENCEMMEELFSIVKIEKDGEHCHHMITFPKLKRLTLVNLRSLTTFCKGVKNMEFTAATRTNQRVIFFGVLFPMLEDLLLVELDKVEEICHGPIPEGSNSFKNLCQLSLHQLPMLEHLWNSTNQNVSLCNLSKIEIYNCDKLRNLFTSTMSKACLLQLSQLEIRRCEMMEEVLLNEDSEKDENPWYMIELPQLEKLILDSLGNLTTFGKGVESIKFPMLKYMEIRECPKLISFVSSSGNNQNSIGGPGEDTFTMFCSLKVKHLDLSRLPALKYLWKISPNQDASLSNLSKIQDFLLQLEFLAIEGCEMMEQVLLNEENEKDGNEGQMIVFPKLKELVLDSLTSLTTFGKGIENIEFPKLKYMRIRKCPKLMSVGQNSSGGHDDDTFHLFCSQKVEFHSLKVLEIRTHFSNMWCRQISLYFFSQLEILFIFECDGIKNSLFSSSIVENLVNLKWLGIENCKEIIKVIEDEEKSFEKSILFPSLKELTLFNLPKLRSFCEWRWDLQLPSLERVGIRVCPVMEYLTMESLSTPNLEVININEVIDIDREKKDVGNLNDAIQLHFKANEQHKWESTSSEGEDEIEEEEVDE